MKIQFLQTSEHGLRWMVDYYQSHPQLNYKTAMHSYKATKKRIATLPYSGTPHNEIENVWESSIPRTPFSILYTIMRDKIYIIDIRDQRGNRSVHALRTFHNELKMKIDK